MIRQLRVAAGVDLRLSHSCLAEPYRASVDVFPPEWDHLPVLPGGQEKMAWSIRYQIPLCGIWGMATSPSWARPRWPSVIPELRLFVGILWWKPPHQLHVNPPVYDSIGSGCPAPQTHDKVGLPTHHHQVFEFGSLRLLHTFGHICSPCIKTHNSFMHAYNHIWAFLACGGAKQSPLVTKTLPAVLGIHLLFHTRADLWAQQLQACNSLGRWGLRSWRQVGGRRKWWTRRGGGFLKWRH